MATFRSAIPDFQLANPIYVGATINFYTVDGIGIRTSTLATLYAAPTGAQTLGNPQVLDGDGKFQTPVYISVPVIAEVVGTSTGTHTTGVIGVRGVWRGEWATGVLYFSEDYVQDPASGSIYAAIYDYTSGASLAADVAAENLQLAFDVQAVVDQVVAEAGAAIGAIDLPSATFANPLRGASNDRRAIDWNVTADLSNQATGWSSVGGTSTRFFLQNGGHTSAFSGNANGKLTAYAGKIALLGPGAGQKIGHWIDVNTPGAGDTIALGINAFNVTGGEQAGGDEGYHMFRAETQQPTGNYGATLVADAVRGGGGTTTTQAIVGSEVAQTRAVASAAGIEANKWYVINNADDVLLDLEAVKLTAVDLINNTITGVFRNSQASGVTVTPATVLSVPAAYYYAFGEHRFVVNTAGPSYAIGTVDWSSLENDPVLSGGTWADNMVGGDAHRPGMIAVTADTTGGGMKSWYAIKSIDSATTMTTRRTRAYGLATDTALGYIIRPGALILRAVPNGDNYDIVCETTSFDFLDGDTVEVANGPGLGAVGLYLTHTSHMPGSGDVFAEFDTLGEFLPSRAWISLVNAVGGAAPFIAGSNQSAFISANTNNTPGSVNYFLKSQKTTHFASVTIANGGSYNFGQYGIALSGLVENAVMTKGSGGPGAAVQIDPVWNHNSQHDVFGCDVTDTLSSAGSTLLNLNVGGVNKFKVTKDGALTSAASVTATFFKCGTCLVSTLGAGSIGEKKYPSDLRVYDGAGTLEGAGAGTGGSAEHNGTAWKISGTNATASA